MYVYSLGADRLSFILCIYIYELPNHHSFLSDLSLSLSLFIYIYIFIFLYLCIPASLPQDIKGAIANCVGGDIISSLSSPADPNNPKGHSSPNHNHATHQRRLSYMQSRSSPALKQKSLSFSGPFNLGSLSEPSEVGSENSSSGGGGGSSGGDWEKEVDQAFGSFDITSPSPVITTSPYPLPKSVTLPTPSTAACITTTPIPTSSSLSPAAAISGPAMDKKQSPPSQSYSPQTQLSPQLLNKHNLEYNKDMIFPIKPLANTGFQVGTDGVVVRLKSSDKNRPVSVSDPTGRVRTTCVPIKLPTLAHYQLLSAHLGSYLTRYLVPSHPLCSIL